MTRRTSVVRPSERPTDTPDPASADRNRGDPASLYRGPGAGGSAPGADFATLKGDLIPRTSFPTRAQARTAVVAYIEGWYNRRRPHQYTDGVPPMVALERWDDRPETSAA